MASAVYTEAPASSRLSIALEGEASASPFPSPSSSFLPPPTPGAHEFAVKPAPAARNGRKLSAPTAHVTTTTTTTTTQVNGDLTAPAPRARPGSEPGTQQYSSSMQSPALAVNGLPQAPDAFRAPSSPSPDSASSSSLPSPSGGLPSSAADAVNSTTMAPTTTMISTTKEASPDVGNMLPPPPSSPFSLSPTTPTPYNLQHHVNGRANSLEPPPRSPGMDGSTSSSTTPTIQTLALPPEDNTTSTAPPPSSGLPTTPTTAKTTTKRIREDDDGYPAKIIIPNTLDAGLTLHSTATGTSAPASPAFSTFSNTSNRSHRNSRPLSTSFGASSSTSPSLFSNRPAPPSPAVSRRVSGVPSISASTRSKSSRPPSQAVSRANSLRKSTSSALGAGSGATGGGGAAWSSPVMQPHRLSQSFAASPLPSPLSPAFALNVSGPPTATTGSSSLSPQDLRPTASTFTAAASVTAAILTSRIKVRDFGYPASDERHCGLGPDVPRANKVARLNRRLGAPRTHSISGSVASSDDGEGMDEEEEEEEDFGNGGDWTSSSVFGTLRWLGGGGAYGGGGGEGGESGFPSKSDLDMNFRTDAADEDWEGYDEAQGLNPQDEDDEDTLYPGLYRALYAFEPEGTAEMRLLEDQVVRVVGRGGGVGWAVVVDESAKTGEPDDEVRHALVPESYLEPVRLDWEDEETAGGVPVLGDVVAPPA